MALSLCWLPVCVTPASAQTAPPTTDPIAILGDFRPYGDAASIPDLLPAPCPNGESGIDCAKQHGTYVPDRFYRIFVGSAPGNFTIISDGGVRAELASLPDAGNGTAPQFSVKVSGGASGTLILNGLHGHCDSAAPLKCFEIIGMPEDSVLPNGTYVQGIVRAEGPRSETLGGQFANLPPNFGSVLQCADIAKIAFDDLTDLGCGQKPLFLGPNDPSLSGSKRYDIVPLSEHNYVIPYGWQAHSRSQGWGSESVRIIESSEDLMHSQSSSIGFNVSANLFFASLSVQHNEKTDELTDDMYKNSLTYSQYGYFQTQFALILDRQNVALSADFITDVKSLARDPAPDFKGFVERWGTHYVHAATFGEKGSLFSKYTTDQVTKIHESGIDVTTAITAGVSFEGVGVSTGVNTGEASKQRQTLTSILGNNFGEFECTGGVSCNGKTATGGANVPVLIDLRPITDLIGPPFFQSMTLAKILKVRDGLTTAIVEHAYGAPGPSGASAMFMAITDMLLKRATVLSNAIAPNKNLVLGSSNDGPGSFSRVFTMPQDGSMTVPLLASGTSWIVPWTPGIQIVGTADGPEPYCKDMLGQIRLPSSIGSISPPSVAGTGSGRLDLPFACPLMTPTSIASVTWNYQIVSAAKVLSGQLVSGQR